MSIIRAIWSGMLTKNTEDSGTDSKVVLIVNQNGVDKVNHSYEDTSQDDQEKGQANIYYLFVEDSTISRENLDDGSFRIALLGNDLWRPEHYFIWGYDGDDNITYPLAAEMNINNTLSTDYSEGVISIPIRRVATGSDNMLIRRLAIFVRTRDKKNAGTDSPVNLQIKRSGNLIFDYDFPDTPQKDLEEGKANLYIAPVGTPFQKNDLDSQSIVLSIKGTDRWSPYTTTIFGLNHAEDRPTAMVTLVDYEWSPYEHMSTDSSEGEASMVLSLAPSPPSTFPDEIKAISAMLRDHEMRISKAEGFYRKNE